MKPFLLLYFVLVSVLSSAHGDLHARIEALSKAISQDNTNTELFYKRASLFYQHDAFKLALNDIEIIHKLDNEWIKPYLLKAKSEFALHRFSQALSSVNVFLESYPQALEAMSTKVFILLKSEDKSCMAYWQSHQKALSQGPQRIYKFSHELLNSNIADTSFVIDILEYALQNQSENIILYKKILPLYLAERQERKIIYTIQQVLRIQPNFNGHEILENFFIQTQQNNRISEIPQLLKVHDE